MIRVLWFCPYDLSNLPCKLNLKKKTPQHPSSWIVNSANALAHLNDISLHIACLTPHIDRDTHTAVGSVYFHILRKAIPFSYKPYPSYLPLDTLSLNFLSVLKLRSLAKEIRPDIIHAHGTEAEYAQAASGLGYPLLISVQGIVTKIHEVWWSPHTLITGMVERKTIRRNIHFACRTHFDSGFISQTNPEAKVHILHEAINPLFFSTRPDSEKKDALLYVGLLHKRKGIETIIDAMPYILHKRSSASLTIVGSGRPSYVDKLKRKCNQLGIQHAVSFRGFLSAGVIADIHKKSALLVFPSFIDNSPNTIVEAMASHLPVVASDAGGITSIIEDNHTGFICRLNDPQAWSEKIVHILSDSIIMRKVAAKAADVARERNWPERVADNTLGVYRQILGYN